jgi:DNA primase
VNDELDRAWKEEVVAYYASIYQEGLKKTIAKPVMLKRCWPKNSTQNLPHTNQENHSTATFINKPYLPNHKMRHFCFYSKIQDHFIHK